MNIKCFAVILFDYCACSHPITQVGRILNKTVYIYIAVSSTCSSDLSSSISSQSAEDILCLAILRVASRGTLVCACWRWLEETLLGVAAAADCSADCKNSGSSNCEWMPRRNNEQASERESTGWIKIDEQRAVHSRFFYTRGVIQEASFSCMYMVYL